jgi:hypothetical protein
VVAVLVAINLLAAQGAMVVQVQAVQVLASTAVAVAVLAFTQHTATLPVSLFMAKSTVLVLVAEV